MAAQAGWKARYHHSVIGGIDIALWDLKAKAAGLPLYKLLGGFTNRIPAYIAGGYYEEGKGLKELAQEMKQNLEIGAKAVKMKVGAVPINEDVERVRVVREADITTRVIGGIDIALWDLKAKAAGLPLYKLLGGFTNRIPAYIAGGYYEEGKGLKELAQEMKQNLEIGAKAVKMKVGAVPINEDVERVRVVREAVGPDIKVMVDANNAYRHYEAIEFARKVEKYDVFWFEEPVEPDDYIGQAEITRATSVPVAAGENEYTRYGFRDMINHRAVDILQPDAQVLGGITEFMKVAALAQANDLDIAPHGAQEIHIHLACAIPNGLILEYYRDSVDPMHGRIYKDTIRIKDGYVYAPDRPGLGIELNREALAPHRVA